MKKILLLPNEQKDVNFVVTQKIIDWFSTKDIKIYLPHVFKDHSEYSHMAIAKNEISHMDYGIVLGGDGTIISASRVYADYDLPLLGINMGNLGFLAEVEMQELEESLDAFARDEFELEKRMMITAGFKDQGIIGHALNDVVITRDSISRMISFDVYVNKKYVNSYRADGIIISTPTGSTAYNLSAGGPIITPNNEVIVMTPICPHSLTARSMVLDGDDIIDILFDHPKNQHVNDLLVTMDGQEVTYVNKTDEIRLQKADKKVRLVRFNNNDFFEILRRKLS